MTSEVSGLQSITLSGTVVALEYKQITSYGICSLFLTLSLAPLSDVPTIAKDLDRPAVKHLTEARSSFSCRTVEETAQLQAKTSACTVHVQVSAAAAYYSTGLFAASRFWTLIAGAIMIIAWLNLRCDCVCSAQIC